MEGSIYGHIWPRNNNGCYIKNENDLKTFWLIKCYALHHMFDENIISNLVQDYISFYFISWKMFSRYLFSAYQTFTMFCCHGKTNFGKNTYTKSFIIIATVGC